MYLKTVYKNSPVSPNSKWPPTPSREYISLAVVEGEECRDDYIGHTLQGNVKEVLNKRKVISIEQILEPVKGQDHLRLVFMEGAPGIGKSTLAWELCRKWEEFSCMKQYSLVILLRLREKKVQLISKVSDLFSYCENKELVEEVVESQGSGLLFILDGFDELPKEFQENCFLLDLISGQVLPASTVLVTSRPSATAELLRSCGPRIQKCIEILGFTQKSVEAYASSVFSSEPQTLEKFKVFISASSNPAINSLMYIPLNAAIIVRIFQTNKSDSFMPRTLTELYTLLCLTYLNRYLDTSIDRIEDLPSNLLEQFLRLCELAFQGVENQEVIFHTVPRNLVHFGFLDSVIALYGGGRVSYNFLHLTIQEFLAAYHISSLHEGGLGLFEKYGKEKQWRQWIVVWCFVAGLTKFQYYPLAVDQMNLHFFFRYLYEAQSVEHFNLKFVSEIDILPQHFNKDYDSLMKMTDFGYYTLECYELGYCISTIPTGLQWNITFDKGIPSGFLSGLKITKPSANMYALLLSNSSASSS